MDDRIYCSPSMFINSSESDKTRDAYRASLLEFCISKWGRELDDEARLYGRVVLDKGTADRLLEQLSEYIRDPNRSDVLEDLQVFRSYRRLPISQVNVIFSFFSPGILDIMKESC